MKKDHATTSGIFTWQSIINAPKCYHFKSLLTLGILFSTALWAAVVLKLVKLGILFLFSFIIILRVALVAKLVMPGIFSSIFVILALYKSFLTI